MIVRQDCKFSTFAYSVMAMFNASGFHLFGFEVDNADLDNFKKIESGYLFFGETIEGVQEKKSEKDFKKNMLILVRQQFQISYSQIEKP